jgi:hypothetical protein
MKSIRCVFLILVLTGLAAGFIGWQKVGRLRRTNEALRTEIQTLKQQAGQEAQEQLRRREDELQRLRTETQEIQKLRNEVSQLRAGAKEADQLRMENQQLRAAVATPTSSATAATASTPTETTSYFARENWNFAGYATPEAALISAVWAMREGNPKTYLDSLSPEEQLRMTRSWESKPEAEIAAKHQQDVAAITGVRILERQNVSQDEVLMSVYVEGVRRMEIVSMNRVGNEWKFGGFRRNAPK